MKAIITLFLVAIISFTTTAQDKVNPGDQKGILDKKTAEKKYWCTHCDFSSTTSGICPLHKSVLVKEGMYFCKGQEASATEKVGTCPDGTTMIKMDEVFIKKNKDAAKGMVDPKESK